MKAKLKPYYQDEYVTLYHGNALVIAPALGLLDVAAVVTDPPYGETSLEWDRWPAGWPSLARSLSRVLWCFGSFRMFWDQRREFDGWHLAQDLVWEKHNGSGLHADRFKRVHELPVHFYQGDWGSIYNQPPTVTMEHERRREKLRRGAKPQHWGGIEQGAAYEYDGTRIMRSVIPVRSCHGYAVNETQKPEGIVEPLLTCSVPPGGLVLDLFAGSGTTLAVARQQGKRAIGIELREEQCAKIVARLAQNTLQLN